MTIKTGKAPNSGIRFRPTGLEGVVFRLDYE